MRILAASLLLATAAGSGVVSYAGFGDDLRAVDPALREKHLAERFPGVHEIRHVHLLAAAAERSGACWSELTRPAKAKISVRYALEGDEEARERRGLDTLEKDGWSAVYRTPLGEGFERDAPFRSLDLTYETELRCRCAPQGEIVESEPLPVRLRYRWKAGERPEVSAASNGALTPRQTFGTLVSYAFPVAGAFPEGHAGGCAAEVTLTTIVDPPIR